MSAVTLSPAEVIAKTAAAFGMTPGLLLSSTRSNPVAWARHAAAYILRRELHLSYPQIAEAIQRRDHGTAMNSVAQAEHRMTDSMSFAAIVHRVIEQIRSHQAYDFQI